MKAELKTRSVKTLAIALMLTSGQPLVAQVLADPAASLQEAVQGLVERQVEQAQNAALERTVGQAEAAAAGQVLERAEALQAEIVQQRAQEQLLNQVERLQSTVATRAEAAIGQVQVQVENVQRQLDSVASLSTRAAAPFISIELEPGVRVVQSEWIMIVTPVERAHLNAEASALLAYLTSSEQLTFAGGVELLTFTVPPDLDADASILQLVPESLRDRIDRNHIYEADAQVAPR